MKQLFQIMAGATRRKIEVNGLTNTRNNNSQVQSPGDCLAETVGGKGKNFGHHEFVFNVLNLFDC